MRAGTPGVDYPLRDSFVVEARELLTQMEVFDEGRASQPSAQRVVRIGDRDALVGRERFGRRVAAERL